MAKGGDRPTERLAERMGFEPMIRVSPYNGLANRRLQPLGHLSGPAGMPEGVHLDKRGWRLDRHVRPRPRRVRPGEQQREEVPRRLVVFFSGCRLDEMIRTEFLAHEERVRPRDIAADD